MEENENDDAAATRERPQDGGRDARASGLQTQAEATATLDAQPSDDADQCHTTTTSVSAAFARRNPFDSRVSLKDPFPSFEDSMAGFRPDADEDASEERDGDQDASGLLSTTINSSPTAASVNLDWSIDTIAELKPMAFSPLSEQKNPNRSALDDTPSSAAPNLSFNRFFEDEAQYKVLRTPSPLIRRQQEQQQQTQPQQHLAQVRQRQRQQPPNPHSSASPTTPGPPPRAPTPSSIPSHTLSSAQRRLSLSSSASSSNLHRRCQDAIAFCENQLRERERKLSRLQLPQSSSSPAGLKTQKKNRNKRFRAPHERDSEFPWKTHSQQRGSELKGIHPRSTPLSSKPGARSGSLGFSSMQPSPFSIPFTPIASARGLQTPAKKKNQRVDPEFSFDGGSPISPIAPLSDHNEVHEEEEEKDNGSKLEAGAKSPSFDSSPSFSNSDGEERDKENRASASQLKPTAGGAPKPRPNDPGVASLSDSTSFTLSTSSSWGKAAEDSFSLRTLARLQGDQSDRSLSFISASTPDPSGPPRSQAEPRWSQSEPREQDTSHKPQLLASPSIAQRQESFMAAIEAEARTRSPSSPPSSASDPQQSMVQATPSSSHKSSIAELFQEARTQGIVEPRAQHEYVQLLKQQQRGGHQHL